MLLKLNMAGQCNGTVVGFFPATINGVTVTETYTGSVAVGAYYTICNVTSGQAYLGGGSPTAFIQKLSFSIPVNNIVYILNASDSCTTEIEAFTFSVNIGTLIATQSGSTCLYIQSGNTFTANTYGPPANAAYITLSSSQSYNSITISGPGGCAGSFMALCSSSIGIDEIKGKNELSFYPNPAEEKLNLKGSTELNHINIMNSIGQVVFQFQSHQKNEQLDISQLPKGLYLLQTSIGSSRFIKE